MEFVYDDDGGLGKGGDVTLYIDGTKAGEGRVEVTMPLIFPGDEATDLGADTGTPVSDDYASVDAPSAARSSGCRSTSTRLPRAPTT